MARNVKQKQKELDDLEVGDGEKFQLVAGGSILLKDGTQLLPGDLVCEGEDQVVEIGSKEFSFRGFSREKLSKHLLAGSLEEWEPPRVKRPKRGGKQRQQEQDPRLERNPSPRLPLESDADKDAPESRSDSKAEKEARDLAKQAKAETAKPKKAPISPWVIDPKKLEGKNLVQLNGMIKERDAKQAPFEDLAEAAAFLSRDFTG